MASRTNSQLRVKPERYREDEIITSSHSPSQELPLRHYSDEEGEVTLPVVPD